MAQPGSVGLGMGGAGFKSLVGQQWSLGTTAVASPSAGAEWTVTVPSGEVWELLQVENQFVTAAASILFRIVNLQAKDTTGDVIMRVGNPTYQHFNTTRIYRWMTNLPLFINNVGSAYLPIEMQGPLPNKVVLLSGYTLGSIVGNIQAADQHSGLKIKYRRYTNPSLLSFL